VAREENTDYEPVIIIPHRIYQSLMKQLSKNDKQAQGIARYWDGNSTNCI